MISLFPLNTNMSNHPLILNLPSEITIDILSRLPIKTIISCKCVCKSFLELTSTPDFAKSHLLRSNPGLAVYTPQSNEDLYQIFEFEDALDLHRYNPVMTFNPGSFIESSDNFIEIASSVNGLFFLHEIHSAFGVFYLCNPITREYIVFPKIQHFSWLSDIVAYGFGVSSSNGQYKVVRIFHEPVETGRSSMPEVECLIYSLGTGSCRKIPSSVRYEYGIWQRNGAFLNGCLHWLVRDSMECQVISCLDLETESFKSFPPPFSGYLPYNSRTLAVVEDCLWFCDYSSEEDVVLWVMKEYGVEESWVKHVVIRNFPDLCCLSQESVCPLMVFKNGDILFLGESGRLFHYSNRTKTMEEVCLFGDPNFDAVPHISSFVSLKIFAMENVMSF